ncbi:MULTISPECIES: hypothetical protein [unclassified Paenibacillus]|uniref:hypothetical protein n=1 Tax=unclassified Paenibacillus TaxID=185978 RepID=UPI0036404661
MTLISIETTPQAITVDEVYAQFRTHFDDTHPSEIFKAARTAFPNRKVSQYDKHAETPPDHRHRIVKDSVVHVMRYYFEERNTVGYVPRGYGKPARKLILPTVNERRCIELLTDFLLADDLAAGLLLKDRFREETDENCLEFPPLGGAARAYQEKELNLLTTADLKRRKVCESCLSYFIDTSPGFNAKRCGPRCTRWSEMLRFRAMRSHGDKRRKRDKERQQHENPFYSPYELEHLNTYPERCYTDDAIDRKVQSYKRGGGSKKPQGVTMDSPEVTSHHKPYNPSEKGESGQMITRKRRPEVVKRYLRMKYGIGRIPRADKHSSETENTSSCVDIFMAVV